jgi:hypothetical protein
MPPKVPDARRNAGLFILLAAFVAMIAMNAFLAAKVGMLARDVERLNIAYGEAIESLSGLREFVYSLPGISLR